MNLVILPKHSRSDVALESLKSRIGRACLLQHFQEKPAYALSTPQVYPLSHKLQWTNQKHLYCFVLKPIRDGLAPGFLRALFSLTVMRRRALGSFIESRGGKTIEMWWRWWWWRANNRNVVVGGGGNIRNVVAVVVVEGKQYKCGGGSGGGVGGQTIEMWWWWRENN